MLFSHPRYKTPVCSTELGEVEKLKPEFEKRNVKTIGLSVDTVDETSSWLDDIMDISGAGSPRVLVGQLDTEPTELERTEQGK